MGVVAGRFGSYLWEVHEERVARYKAGMLDSRRRRAFESHLSRCARCRRTLSAADAAGAGLDAAMRVAPTAALAANIDRLVRPDETESRKMTPGLRALLLAVAVAAAFWGLDRLREIGADRMNTKAEIARARARLSIPMPEAKPRIRTVQEVPLRGPIKRPPALASSRPRIVRGVRKESAMRGAVKAARKSPMPERPLDCRDPGAVQRFQFYVWSEFGGGEPALYGHVSRIASCVCPGAEPAVPSRPPRSEGRALASCPGGTLTEADALRLAKYFYKDLPVSRVQAVRLARCYCGNR